MVCDQTLIFKTLNTLLNELIPIRSSNMTTFVGFKMFKESVPLILSPSDQFLYMFSISHLGAF